MAEPGDTRVAVYFDFDNIVISRYDQVHGRSQFQRDRARDFGTGDKPGEPVLAAKLAQATVDVGAIIDFASSFGTLVLTRAYADWSAPVNADYRGQLVSRAVDLVQLFPAAAYAKNGADIRLAVDAVEDMFRLPDLTHVVIVAGDSDYIALAQRCKRLGRYVVGIGVAGSTSRSLAAACDELVVYDALPGIPELSQPAEQAASARASSRRAASGQASAGTSGQAGSPQAGAGQAAAEQAAPGQAAAAPPASGDALRVAWLQPEDTFTEPVADGPDAQAAATKLLQRALELGHQKDDAAWLHSSEVKNQMKRMDPSFHEKSLGFRSFSDFVRSRGEIAEFETGTSTRLRRVDRTATKKAAAKKTAATQTAAPKVAAKKATAKKAATKKASTKKVST